METSKNQEMFAFRPYDFAGALVMCTCDILAYVTFRNLCVYNRIGMYFKLFSSPDLPNNLKLKTLNQISIKYCAEQMSHHSCNDSTVISTF